jgi:hypothetical protein
MDRYHGHYLCCTGGMTPELEIILAEGAGLQPGYPTQKIMEKRNRCKLGQVALAGNLDMK